MANDLAGWSLPLDRVKQLYPKANPIITNMIADHLIKWAPAFDITDRENIRELLAQMGEESMGLTKFEESLGYSAKRLTQVWPKRFPTLAAAAPYAMNPKKLANKVYANRMGNGDEASGDGYRFRGKGALQITGKDNTVAVGNELGQDIVANPELLLQPEWVLPAALAMAKLLKLGKITGIEADTKRLNGGSTNLASRREWLNKVRKLFP
ncbi:glycoside hydrolase family 19 protein [Aestuariivirga sp.]|uniref:glycoside hydrolase family 19 protein n=1 Tax=Aestuariivirga sp. TaxID=2650926 RepID=UPI0039E49884